MGKQLFEIRNPHVDLLRFCYFVLCHVALGSRLVANGMPSLVFSRKHPPRGDAASLDKMSAIVRAATKAPMWSRKRQLKMHEQHIDDGIPIRIATSQAPG